MAAPERMTSAKGTSIISSQSLSNAIAKPGPSARGEADMVL
jgi:hypothetical protein